MSYHQETKAKIVDMLDASEGKHRSKWDIASEAMQIVMDAYMVKKSQDFILECAEYFEERQDCEIHTDTGHSPNIEMTHAITANTILTQTKNFHQMRHAERLQKA